MISGLQRRTCTSTISFCLPEEQVQSHLTSNKRRKHDRSARLHLTWKRLAGTCFLDKCVCTWSTACFEKGFGKRKRRVSNRWKREEVGFRSPALLLSSPAGHQPRRAASAQRVAATPAERDGNTATPTWEGRGGKMQGGKVKVTGQTMLL